MTSKKLKVPNIQFDQNKVSENKTKKRILIADKDQLFARRLGEGLDEKSYEVRYAYSVKETKETLEFWKPDLLMVDLILPETNAFSLLNFLQKRANLKPEAVVVTSRQAHKKLVAQILKLGATGYLSKPFSVEDAAHYIEAQLTPVVTKPKLAVSDEAQREINLMNLFVKQALSLPRDSVSLHNLMRMISIRTGALRVSVMQVISEHQAMILAANDDSLITGKMLKLEKYPEIQTVVKNKSIHCIESARESELMSAVKEEFHQTPFESLAVFPIYEQGHFFGVMSVRLPRTEPEDMNFVRSFGGFCSDIISLTIGIHG